MVNSIRLYNDYIKSFDDCLYPSITLNNLIIRIIINRKFIESEIIISLIYFDRFFKNKLTTVNLHNAGIIYAISILLSDKWISDYDLIISNWEKLLNISLEEIKLLEIEYLTLQNWNLHITKEEYLEKLNFVNLIKKEFLKNIFEQNKNKYYLNHDINYWLEKNLFTKDSKILLYDIIINIISKYQLDFIIKRKRCCIF